jgi:ergothioneine biosynthesis protein EgtB
MITSPSAGVVSGTADKPGRARNRHSQAVPVLTREQLLEEYSRVRQFSEQLCKTLEPEDYVIQTMPEMSPAKWHLAHTSWFFETFVVKPRVTNYRPLNPQYAFLFNSYYNAAGKMHARPQRGLISRPTVRETYAYRRHVDEAMEELMEAADERTLEELANLVVLGLNHEQQHQELILTDIKHVFWMNPLRPAFCQENRTSHESAPPAEALKAVPTPLWHDHDEGICEIGHEGQGFCFDNEGPRHKVWLNAFSIATQLVTNREYLEFMEDGGYQRAEFWLSLGWTVVNERGWNAPFYWEERDGTWWQMTLAGMRPVQMSEPVCHVSYFEADAYARWAGARLPSEAEWEVSAETAPIEGSFAESGHFHPVSTSASPSHISPGPGRVSPGNRLCQMFGEVWQWTQSAYSPYPGYQPAAGALGEYNGKFMCNQYVLRGASCATPRSHARRTYRNFFPPDARWQFMGVRLARDLS